MKTRKDIVDLIENNNGEWAPTNTRLKFTIDEYKNIEARYRDTLTIHLFSHLDTHETIWTLDSTIPIDLMEAIIEWCWVIGIELPHLQVMTKTETIVDRSSKAKLEVYEKIFSDSRTVTITNK